jgi:hypothetical protein
VQLDVRAWIPCELATEVVGERLGFLVRHRLDLDQHVGHRGALVARRHVVIDLRVTLADGRRDPAHLAVARHDGLDEARRAVRLGQAGPVVGLDLHDELGNARLGEEAEADARHQRDARGD